MNHPPDPLGHPGSVDNGQIHGLARAHLQIHTIPDAHRVAALGLALPPLSVVGGMMSPSGRGVLPLLTEGAIGVLLAKAENSLNLQLRPFVVELVEALVGEAYLQARYLAGAEAQAEALWINQGLNIVCLQPRLLGTLRCRLTSPHYHTRLGCCLHKTRNPTVRAPKRMASKFL